MKRFFLVEPIVALYYFAGVLVSPLIQQYVYRRLWQQLTNTSYPVSHNATQCGPDEVTNHSAGIEEVQRQSSLFFLYMDLFTIIPSLVVTLFLVAYSDQKGRKVSIIMPVIGDLIFCLSFLAISYFELNIYLLAGAALVSSLFGGSPALLGGCFAYIADLCVGSQTTIRIAGVDMLIGVMSAVAGISAGYFLQAAGFNWPVLMACLCYIVTLLYAVFLLEETVKETPYTAIPAPPRRPALMQAVSGVVQMFRGLVRRDLACLVLLMLIIATFVLAYVGGRSSVTLYELNEPLCWDAILIGYDTAFSASFCVSSFLGVAALTYCRIPQPGIVLVGLLSVAFGFTLMSFAKTTLAMFLVRIPLALSIMPFPVLRNMMSKIVSTSEQGALFGCVAFLESLTASIGSTIFNSTYALTVGWWSGFNFLLAAGLTLIPCILLGTVTVLGANAGETRGLVVSEEVEPGVGDDMPA